MLFNPSSIVKTAPHLGHFTFVSLLTIPAQPKENAAKTVNTKTMLISFFTPLHLLSFGRYLQKKGGEKAKLRAPSIAGGKTEAPEKLTKGSPPRF